ncbi:MAG: aspartate aminotransferase family protein [Pirellulales bacterium]
MTNIQFPGSERLHQSASEVLATGVSSGMRRRVTPTPLYFDRGQGPYFWDVDNHRFLDYTLGWGPLILGNNHRRVNDAVAAQLQRGYTFGAQHELEIRVARQIVELVPGIEQVIFSNTGSEAVQAAVRIARALTGRNKIVKFEGHYHGWMNNVLVSYHPTGGEPSESQATCGGQPPNEFADTIVLPWNDIESLRSAFDHVGDGIAAVITEPLLANSGCCEPREGFLQGLIELCRRHGAVSIFDEVITGFRLAAGGAREYYKLAPDLSVYGKAIAAGFSLSAVAGRKEMFDVLRDGRTFHAGTYNGNPICLAAASAALEVLADGDAFSKMHAHGQSLWRKITSAAESHGQPLVVCGAGTVFNVHWGVSQAPRDYRETLRSDAEAYTRFRMEMLNQGVYLLPDGRWYVGATHDDQALELAVNAIDHSIANIN